MEITTNFNLERDFKNYLSKKPSIYIEERNIKDKIFKFLIINKRKILNIVIKSYSNNEEKNIKDKMCDIFFEWDYDFNPFIELYIIYYVIDLHKYYKYRKRLN